MNNEKDPLPAIYLMKFQNSKNKTQSIGAILEEKKKKDICRKSSTGNTISNIKKS